MIAALGMYDMPQIQAANDRYWALIRAQLGEGPANLTRDADPWEIWRARGLVLAQTCGMPYRVSLHDEVTLIGTPDYGLPDCPPGYYCSVFIAHADASGSVPADFADGVFAYNEALSQSGWAGPMSHLNTLGVKFQHVIPTGAHASSAIAVAERRADLAGIDALTWTLLCEHDPVAEKLKVVGRTTPAPGLPYITSKTRAHAPIANAIRNAIESLTAQDRKSLHLKGLIDIPKSVYLDVQSPPGPDQNQDSV